MNSTNVTAGKLFRILSLDGGGAKGFYSLGVLQEVEALVKKPLHEQFNLIYGTSTGAIIASLLGLGRSVEQVFDLYNQHVVPIMRGKKAAEKSSALAKLAEKEFREAGFGDMKTDVGIVTAKWFDETPLIFKTSIRQAHGRPESFVPGFGCRVGDAVQASCSAYPYFQKKVVLLNGKERMELIDGGYCANNPALYAITDAVQAMKVDIADIRVLTVGVGSYPKPPVKFHLHDPSSWKPKALSWIEEAQLIQKTLNFNGKTTDQLRQLLFPTVPTVRVDETYAEPEMATDLFEHDLSKLTRLYRKGRDSFGRAEADIRNLMQQ